MDCTTSKCKRFFTRNLCLYNGSMAGSIIKVCRESSLGLEYMVITKKPNHLINSCLKQACLRGSFRVPPRYTWLMDGNLSRACYGKTQSCVRVVAVAVQQRSKAPMGICKKKNTTPIFFLSELRKLCKEKLKLFWAYDNNVSHTI